MREPKSAKEWTDLVMAWYEGHCTPLSNMSQAFRDEIERALNAYASQRVVAALEDEVSRNAEEKNRQRGWAHDD